MGISLANVRPGQHDGHSRVEAGAVEAIGLQTGTKIPFPYPSITIPLVPKPPMQTFSKEVVERGKALYESHLCSGCHSPGLDGSGAWTVNGAIPDLRYALPEVHSQWYGIVLAGTHRDAGMLGFGTDLQFPNIKNLVHRKPTQFMPTLSMERGRRMTNNKKRRKISGGRRPT